MAIRGGSCLLLLLCALAPAGEPTEVSRHVIALVQGTRADPHTDDIVHQLLELPLNHLGMVVHRHYIGNGPPPRRWLGKARAVVTYFRALDDKCDWLWPWLEKEVLPRDLRVVVFGEFGPLGNDQRRLALLLSQFGLDHDPRLFRSPFGIETMLRSREACEYEAPRLGGAVHRGPRNRDERNRAWVRTRMRTEPGDVRAPVVTGAWGGLALSPWAVSEGADRRWHIDPFLFFAEALGLDRVPAPHPSVLNGRRMWFMQVDGDGFESLSTIQPGEFSAKVMRDEVFLRYKLPFTVSIIVRSLTQDYDVAEPTKAMRLAREILNRPHVEPASHGVLHTLEWQEYLPTHHPLRQAMSYPSLKNYKYGEVSEVKESIRFINERLLDEGRKCAVMLWTGSANPLGDAIQAATDSGCVNLNGGVFRWDRWFDSVAFVSPWSRRAGDALQVYAGAANENDFDGFFDTMPGAFAHIDTTIERTGSPRILKPADIYCHFYSAERPARLRALDGLIVRWAFEQPTAPVFASTYSRAVTSAVETARILKTDDGWAFRDFGDCRTVRIDDEPRHVDWRKSAGLLGARRRGRSLYLHLARPDARVVLAREPRRHPHVEEANCLLGDVQLAPDGVQVTATAHNRRVVVFAGFPPRGDVILSLDGEPSRRLADGDGLVTVQLESPGTTRIAVRRPPPVEAAAPD